MPEPARPRALLFDWDNTLVDSWESIHDALNTALEAMGQAPWTRQEVRTRVRASARDSFPQLFGERWREAADIFYQRFESAHLETLRPLPGAGEMLEALARSGLYLGIVSNKRGDLLRLEAEALGWDGLFAKIVGAADVAEDKPSPVPIYHALSGSGIDAGRQVWYAGDALIDIECANRAGCIAVLVGDGHGGEVPVSRPDFTVADCKGLAKLLRVT
ncbi:MAG: HAD family hydrolase [Alphaproteobacteria bacterium]